jgi:hypothetical protein
MKCIPYQPCKYCRIFANTLKTFLDKFELIQMGHLLRLCNFIGFYHPITNKDAVFARKINKSYAEAFFEKIYRSFMHYVLESSKFKVCHCIKYEQQAKVLIPFS